MRELRQKQISEGAKAKVISESAKAKVNQRGKEIQTDTNRHPHGLSTPIVRACGSRKPDNIYQKSMNAWCARLAVIMDEQRTCSKKYLA